MTIERARQLLGKHAKDKTDQEVQELIDMMFEIAKISKEAYFADKLKRNNGVIKSDNIIDS